MEAGSRGLQQGKKPQPNSVAEMLQLFAELPGIVLNSLRNQWHSGQITSNFLYKLPNYWTQKMCLLKIRSIGMGHVFVAPDNQTETKPTNMDKLHLIFHAGKVTNKGSFILAFTVLKYVQPRRGCLPIPVLLTYLGTSVIDPHS